MAWVLHLGKPITMKHNESTIQNKILPVLQEHYAYTVVSIEFIPVGEESYAYLVITDENVRYFVKYCDKQIVLENIDCVNELLLQLKELEFVVPPIVSNGQTSYNVGVGKISVYPYIDGTTVHESNSQFDADLVERLTEIMASIHNATPSVSVQIPQETFRKDHLERFEKIWQAGKDGEFDSDVMRFLAGNERAVRKLISKHDSLTRKYEDTAPDFVLTHGDITGMNIILSKDGIKLVDWDAAMFSPQERDINFLSDNQHFDVNRYLQLTRRTRYYPELTEYYGQEWSLNSIIGNFESLLRGDRSKDEKRDHIAEIRRYLNYY
jgi:thiamine kinase-like enzyme